MEIKSSVINVSVLTCIPECTHWITCADSTCTSVHVLAHCSVPSDGTNTQWLIILLCTLNMENKKKPKTFYLHHYTVNLYTQMVHKNKLDVKKKVFLVIVLGVWCNVLIDHLWLLPVLLFCHITLIDCTKWSHLLFHDSSGSSVVNCFSPQWTGMLTMFLQLNRNKKNTKTKLKTSP